jgi:hypothetical protein
MLWRPSGQEELGSCIVTLWGISGQELAYLTKKGVNVKKSSRMDMHQSQEFGCWIRKDVSLNTRNRMY